MDFSRLLPTFRARALLQLLPALLLAPARQSGAQALERLFYYVDREDSYQSLVKNIDRISVLGPQVYTVDSLGIVFGGTTSRLNQDREPIMRLSF
jgi:hypothetical protein